MAKEIKEGCRSDHGGEGGKHKWSRRQRKNDKMQGGNMPLLQL